MEPIKFEDNIREKLQEREITPSNKSWKKLAKQLEASKTNKRSNKSFWFAIAAGFIGIIIVASFIFKKEAFPANFNPELVEETLQKDVANPVEISEAIVLSKENSSKEEVAELPTKKANKAIQNKKGDAIAIQDIKIETSFIKEPIIDAITNNNNNNNKSETITLLETNKNDDFLNSKIEEVVAQVQALQKRDKAVSAEEINMLLIKAQSEIHSREIVNSKNRKVDAIALLNVVESELESSFRDKVFDALGDGFEKVRTAVVERDN